VESGDEDAQQEMVDRAARAAGYDTPAYHGTTHGYLKIFDPGKFGNKEGFLGAVNYFTSEESDAENNYLSTGADITSRVEAKAEQYAEFIDMDAEEVSDLLGKSIEDLVDEGILDDEGDILDTETVATAMAERELKGNVEAVLPVHLKMQNPAVVSATYKRGLSGIPIVHFSGDQHIDIEGDESRILDAIREAVEENTEDSPDAVIEGMQEDLPEIYMDGVSVSELLNALKGNEELMYLNDYETGELPGSHIIGSIFQKLGFDALVLENADQAFFNMGLPEGTTHYHIFGSTPEQIKSADPITRDDDGNVIPLSRRFQTSSPDIRFAEVPDPEQEASRSRHSLFGRHMIAMQMGREEAQESLRSMARMLFPDVTPDEKGQVLRHLTPEQTAQLKETARGAEQHARAERLNRMAMERFGGKAFSALPESQKEFIRRSDQANSDAMVKSEPLDTETMTTRASIRELTDTLAAQMEEEIQYKDNRSTSSVPANHGAPDVSEIQNELRSVWHNVKRFRRGVFNQLLLGTHSINDLLHILSDNNPNSVFARMQTAISVSERRLTKRHTLERDFLAKAMEDAGIKSFARRMGGATEVGGFAMSREEALSIAMISRGNIKTTETGEYENHAAEALFASNSFDITGSEDREVFSRVLADAWKKVQADADLRKTMNVMDKYYEWVWGEINTERKKMGLGEIGRVDGYYPLIREGGMFWDEDQMAQAMGITPPMLQQRLSTTSRFKHRAATYGGKISLEALSVFNNYRRQANQYIAKEGIVTSLQSATRAAKEQFDRKGLNSEADMLLDLLESERHYNGRISPLTPGELATRAVSSKIKQSIFGLRVPGAIKQIFSISQGMAYLPLVDTWRGPVMALDVTRHALLRGAKNWPNILEGHRIWEIMQEGDSKHTQSQYIATEIGIQRGKAGRFDVELKGVPLAESMLLPMRHADMIGRVATWGAAYDSKLTELNKRRGMDDAAKRQAAFDFAEEVTDRTQPASRMSDRAMAQKSNEYVKAMLPFTGQHFRNWNNTITDLYLPMKQAWATGYREGGVPGALNEALSVFAGTQGAKDRYGIRTGVGKFAAFTYVGPALMLSALARGRMPEDPEELFGDLLAYNVAMVPLIGPVISGALLYNRVSEGAPLYAKHLETAGNLVKSIKNRDTEGLSAATLQSAAMATGFPMSIARTFEKDLKRHFTDQYDNTDIEQVVTSFMFGEGALDELRKRKGLEEN
jgi:hypothetical protein